MELTTDAIFKYQRIQGTIPSQTQREGVESPSPTMNVCCADIDISCICLGTVDGLVLLIPFLPSNSKMPVADDQKRKFQPFPKHRVNAISVSARPLARGHSNPTELHFTIACGYENGNVVILCCESMDTSAASCREVVCSIGEPLRQLYLMNSVSFLTHGRFIAGTESGRLLLHSVRYQSNPVQTALSGTTSSGGLSSPGSNLNSLSGLSSEGKTTVLFSGAHSPVCSIACYHDGGLMNTKSAYKLSSPSKKWEEGNIVAWADLCTVRIMNMATQTAICYLSAPAGVGVDLTASPPSVLCPCPCLLFWENEFDLLIGWADCFRQVRIISQSSGAEEEETGYLLNESGVSAITVQEWYTDCIMCGGVFPLDSQHVMTLGYTPPNAHANLPGLEGNSDSARGVVELLVLDKSSHGEVVSADTLPLQWLPAAGEWEGVGPWEFSLLSSYQCRNGSLSDAADWDLRTYSSLFGGDRGKAPVSFVVAPTDMLTVRVRDVNDRVSSALRRRDLKAAAELARADRNSLRQYEYHELLKAYLLDLLDTDRALTKALEMQTMMAESEGDGAAHAAAECKRLVGVDPLLWEQWIYTFIAYRKVESLAPLLPLDSLRLNMDLYDLVLSSMLQQDPSSTTSTPTAEAFLQCVKMWSGKDPPVFNRPKLLSALEDMMQSYQIDIVHRVTVSNPSEEKLERASAVSCYLEAQAILHTAGGDYAKALNCYLEIKVSDNWFQQASHMDEVADSAHYKHVFDLIERKNLFSAISSKVINLLRLSKPLSRKLLVSHVDKLPVHLVATQLAAADERVLLWYLEALFADAFETYNMKEHVEWHARQIELYVKFAPPRPKNIPTVAQDFAHDFKRRQKGSRYHSDLLHFLQSDLLTMQLLQQVALPLCSARAPEPLYNEMVYILAKLGDSRKALQLHLKEIGNFAATIDFIEEQTCGDANLTLPLWNDLIDHCLQSSEQLGILLDYLGLLSTMDPVAVVSRITAAVGDKVPELVSRISRILRHASFRESLNSSCVDMLETDALGLLRQKNQGLRRAIKVSSSLRCSLCSRPLTMSEPTDPVDAPGPPQPPSSSSSSSSFSLSHPVDTITTTTTSTTKESSSISPSPSPSLPPSSSSSSSSRSGAVILSDRVGYHRGCFAKTVIMPQPRDGNKERQPNLSSTTTIQTETSRK